MRRDATISANRMSRLWWILVSEVRRAERRGLGADACRRVGPMTDRLGRRADRLRLAIPSDDKKNFDTLWRVADRIIEIRRFLRLN